MLEKYNAETDIPGAVWLTGKAHVLLPPCDRVPVTCSYAPSTCGEYYVGFIQGRFGSPINFRAPLAICWPGGAMRYVTVTTYSERSASFRVPRAEWLIDELSRSGAVYDSSVSRAAVRDRPCPAALTGAVAGGRGGRPAPLPSARPARP